MRAKLILLLVAGLLLSKFNISMGAKGIDLTTIFPSDINKHKILFVTDKEYLSPDDLLDYDRFDSKIRYLDEDHEKVVSLIDRFIKSHEESGHKIVKLKELENYAANDYKYSVHFRQMEFENIIDAASLNSQGQAGSAGGIYRIFKSVFYFKDRQSGKIYEPYYDKTPKKKPSNEKKLPANPPKDKDFFRDLSKYIDRLNK